MDSKLINLTPHSINILRGAEYDSAIRKFRGGEITCTIPSSGMVSAKYAEQPVGEIQGIPVNRKTLISIEEIPNFEPDAVYIVSGLYLAAAKELGLYEGNLVAPGTTSVEADGRTIRGCVGFVG